MTSEPLMPSGSMALILRCVRRHGGREDRRRTAKPQAWRRRDHSGSRRAPATGRDAPLVPTLCVGTRSRRSASRSDCNDPGPIAWLHKLAVPQISCEYHNAVSDCGSAITEGIARRLVRSSVISSDTSPPFDYLCGQDLGLRDGPKSVIRNASNRDSGIEICKFVAAIAVVTICACLGISGPSGMF